MKDCVADTDRPTKTSVDDWSRFYSTMQRNGHLLFTTYILLYLVVVGLFFKITMWEPHDERGKKTKKNIQHAPRADVGHSAANKYFELKSYVAYISLPSKRVNYQNLSRPFLEEHSWINTGCRDIVRSKVRSQMFWLQAGCQNIRHHYFLVPCIYRKVLRQKGSA